MLPSFKLMLPAVLLVSFSVAPVMGADEKPKVEPPKLQPSLLVKEKDYFIHSIEKGVVVHTLRDSGEMKLLEEKAQLEPSLLVKEKGYFIHAIRPGVQDQWGKEILVNTLRDSGEMKVLIASANESTPLEGRHREEKRSRIAGVTWDSERLYVLWCQDVMSIQEPPPGTKGPITTMFVRRESRLIVFCLENGKRLTDLPLKDAVFPTPPANTIDKGPLQARDDGVSCFGTTYKFKGDKLVSEKKVAKDAEPDKEKRPAKDDKAPVPPPKTDPQQIQQQIDRLQKDIEKANQQLKELRKQTREKKDQDAEAKEKIDKFLDILAKVETLEQQRIVQTMQKELIEMGEKAIPHLKVIVNTAKLGAVTQREAVALGILSSIEQRLARNKLPAIEDKNLRIRMDVNVGLGVSRGSIHKPPGYGGWMQLENLSPKTLKVLRPTIASTAGTFKDAQWYVDHETLDKEWDGNLKSGEKQYVLFRGTWEPKGVKGGDEITLAITIDHGAGSLKSERKATVAPARWYRCTCGCTRSEEMMAELRQKDALAALAALDKALAEIAARQEQGLGTDEMIAHRARLLVLKVDLRAGADPVLPPKLDPQQIQQQLDRLEKEIEKAKQQSKELQAQLQRELDKEIGKARQRLKELREQGRNHKEQEALANQIVDKLLARLPKDATPEQQLATRKELVEMGEQAMPRLKEIINSAAPASPGLRDRVAGVVLEVIQDRIACSNRLPVTEDKNLRSRIEVRTIHDGGWTGGHRPHPVPPYCLLWAEVENRTAKKLALWRPTITSQQGTFQECRTVVEGETAGKEWDGALEPHQKQYITFGSTWQPNGVKAGDQITLDITLHYKGGSLKTQQKVWVQLGPRKTPTPKELPEKKPIPEKFRKCFCGCTRSEEMIAELRQQGGPAALAAIDKALAEIAARQQETLGTDEMIAHRTRLLVLKDELRAGAGHVPSRNHNPKPRQQHDGPAN